MTALSYNEYRDRIENGTDLERKEWIDRFIDQFPQPGNDTLWSIVRRDFFAQLRPVNTIDDVLGLAAEKLIRRLTERKLELRTEAEFICFATTTIWHFLTRATWRVIRPRAATEGTRSLSKTQSKR